MAKQAAAADDDDVIVVVEGDEPVKSDNEDADEGDESAVDDDAEQDDASEEAAAGDQDDDSLIDDATREKRERRRLERQQKRQHAREKEDRLKHRLEQQQQTINSQAERLAALERKDVSHDLSQLDQRIRDSAVRAKQAETALQKAIATGDGDLHTRAMKAWYENSREAEALSQYKENLVRAAQQPAPIKTDPVVKSLAEQWATRNNWYDPGTRDADSKVAYALSEALAQEGLSPSDTTYWSELDARLKRYLPHRFEQVERQAKQKPRQPVAGSGRDARSPTGREEFVLSRERVEAIKMAGDWDDPAARKAAVNAYRDYDRKHNNR